MHLIKDNSIIVTKTQYTAEEFMLKRIELLVSDKDSWVASHLVCLLFCRKMRSNLSLPLISKMFASNTFVGSLRCLVSHHTMVSTNLYRDDRSHEAIVAIKCNDDINVIKLLAYLGAGFDCASKVSVVRVRSLNKRTFVCLQGEIKKVMDLGVSGS